jgi:hypothetical protein
LFLLEGKSAFSSFSKEASMGRAVWIVFALVIALGLVPVSSFAAEEHGGATTAEHGGAAPAAEATTTQDTAPPVQTPADPVGGGDTVTAPIPALKPIVITFSGELSSVDANANPAAMTVQDRYGVRKEIAVPAEAKISQGAATKGVTDLKVGDKLTVEYTYDVATGKRTAQSIAIGETAAAAKPQ